MTHHEDEYRAARARVRTKQARLLISSEVLRNLPAESSAFPVRGRYWPAEHLIQLGDFGNHVDEMSKPVYGTLSRTTPTVGRAERVTYGTEEFFLFGGIIDSFVVRDVQVVDLAGEMRSRHGYETDDAAIYSRHILAIGAGSLGSGIVRLLSQAGVPGFTIIDRDVLSPANLSRHSGGVLDLGRSKAEVVAGCINRLFGSGRGIVADVCSMSEQRLKALIDKADLVLVTTDSQAANMRINELVVAAKTPALFAQAWEKASAGEVLAYVPDGHSPCLYCATGFRLQLAEPGPPDGDTLPYQTAEAGSLSAEPGLAADLGLIISAAASYALALLCPEGQRAGALLTPAHRFFLIQSGNEPLEQFQELHPAPFGTAFATVIRSEPCPVCGWAHRGQSS